MTRHLPEQARHEQILAAARRCFIENGFHPTRMDDIAKSAQLSKGGVYFHFKSKREVFDNLVEEEYQRSMEFLRSVAEGDGSIVDKMQVLGRHYLEYFSTATDAPRFFIVMGEMGLRDAQIAERLLQIQKAYIDEISKLIDQGVSEKVLRETDATAVAAILKALLDGTELLQALNYPIDHTRFLTTALDILMNGLARRD